MKGAFILFSQSRLLIVKHNFSAVINAFETCFVQMEEEMTRFLREREERRKQLAEFQQKELEEFDLGSSTMGLDALQIAEASQNSLHDDSDLDTASVRGSVLSLTPSSSTNSFQPINTQL